MGADIKAKISLSSPSKPYNKASRAQITSMLPSDDIPYLGHDMDADERVITALGYKQEFKREFSLWTTFCVSFAVVGLLPSFASTLSYGNCFLALISIMDQALTMGRNGICRNGRYDLGLDHCNDIHPMYCDVHGRAVLSNADEV